MKKLKIVPWVIIVAFIGLVFFQNKAFFTQKQELTLNLYFTDAHQSLHVIVWFLISLVVGFLVAYFFGLTERFKLKKVIKGLKAKIDTQMEMITQIRSELESRTGFPQEETPAAPDDTVETAPEPHDVQVPSDD